MAISALCVSCGCATRDYEKLSGRFPVCRDCLVSIRQTQTPDLDVDEEEF